MLTQLLKIIKILNGKGKPGELALGAVLGMFAAFLMGAPLNFIIVLCLFLALSANLSFFFASLIVFKILAFGVDFIGDKVGYAILTAPFFEQIGNAMANMPVVPFTKFNHTIIMGDFVIAVVLSPFVYFGTKKFVPFYRATVVPVMDKFGIVKVLKATSIFKSYEDPGVK